MADATRPCPYRASHEFDGDGICVHCYAKRPENPYGWIGTKSQVVLDEPLTDIVTAHVSGSVVILNWEQLKAQQAAGRVLMTRQPDGSLYFERVDS